MFRIYIAILFCFISVKTSLSQNIDFNKIKVEDGLPHSTVNDFIQDSLGFIWIATDDGLARYDNNKFKIFNNSYKNGRGIANNQVLCTYLDNTE